MKNRYDLDEFYKCVITSLEKVEKDKIYPSYIYQSIYEGDSKYYQREQIESIKFDDLWIKTIESYFPSINRITINLKSTLKYQSEIIPIEKTKKINKESVIHLMSHSNYIKEINEDGVIPKQILSILPEIEYGIYENRFIMTLINRLRDFVGKRVKLMRQKIKANKIIHLNLNNEFKFEESDFQLCVDIRQIQDVNQRKIDEHNINALERAEKLLRLINRLNNTQFMKVLQRFKPVKSPIMKTQIILSNSDFKNAYLLWLYLDYNNELGYDYNVKSVNKRFDKSYTYNINKSLMMMCSTLLSNDKSPTSVNSSKYKAQYKEKAAKTVKNLPIEVDIEPIAYEIEDKGINEYYLAKNKQILKKQFEDLIKKGSSYKVSLKKALTDTLNITSSLFESFFDINGEEDVFQMLISDDDPEKAYQDAYDKYLVACTLREVKERDFKRSLSLERKWQEELKRCNRRLLEQKELEFKNNNAEVMEELKNKYKNELDIITAREYREKQSLMRKHRAELVVFRKKLRLEHKEKIRELKVMAGKKSKEDKQKAIEQAKSNKLKAQEKYIEEIKAIKIEHQKRMKEIEQQFREKLKKERELLKNKANEALAKKEEMASQKIEEANDRLNKENTNKEIPATKEKIKNEIPENMEVSIIDENIDIQPNTINESENITSNDIANTDSAEEAKKSISIDKLASNKDSMLVKEVLSDLYKLFSEGERASSKSKVIEVNNNEAHDKSYPDKEEMIRQMKDIGLDDKQLWLDNNRIKERLSDCIPSKYKFINNIVVILYKESRLSAVLSNEAQVDEIIIKRISKKLNDAYGIAQNATKYVLELICQLLDIEIIEI